MKKRFVVLVSPAGSNSWAIISPGAFPTLERARGWAKERAEFNGVAAEYTVAELVPREIVRMANLFAGCKSANILNAGQRPGEGQSCVHSPAGGARHSAF